MDARRVSEDDLNAVERAVVDLLRDSSPRTLDDIVAALPGDCFAQVFLIVDRLSREGCLRLLPGRLSYRVALVN